MAYSMCIGRRTRLSRGLTPGPWGACQIVGIPHTPFHCIHQMDLQTLESLGLDIESLGDRIVDQCVEVLLRSTGFDPETEQETRYESRFKREIDTRIQKAVDTKIAALAEEHLLPRVGEMIESANLQQTNNYGEPKGEPKTFIEYIVARAEAYMSEPVNWKLKTRQEESYNWSNEGTRLTVLMKLHIKDTLDKEAKAAVSDVNKVIAKNIAQAAKDAIAAASDSLKVSVSV
jgi:hypothetical protein